MLTSCGGESSNPMAQTQGASIIGNWVTECHIDTGNGVYENIQKVKINENSIEIIIEYYGHSNNNCSQLSEINRHIHPYQKIGNQLILGEATSVGIIFHDASDVVNFNTISLCEFNNWQVGVEKEVVSKNCIPDFDFTASAEIDFLLNDSILTMTDDHNNTISTTRY